MLVFSLTKLFMGAVWCNLMVLSYNIIS